MADNKIRKRLDIAAGVVAAAVCLGCSVQKPTIVYRDSVRVEVHERTVHDSVKFEVPVEVEKIVTRDTASHLENKFAESDAVVSGGFLSHSLKSKPQIIYIPVDVPATDSTFYHDHSETTVQEPEIVKVEKELSWWQKFRIGAFWWLVILAIVGWRREIASLIKKLIKLF